MDLVEDSFVDDTFLEEVLEFLDSG